MKHTRKQRLYAQFIQECLDKGRVYDVCSYQDWQGYWKDDREELKAMMDALPAI